MSSKTSQGTGAAPVAQQAEVRSGAIGASGMGGGSSTPDYGFVKPETSAQLAKMNFGDWLNTVMGASGGHGGAGKRSGSGASAFREAPMAQGSHSLDAGQLIKMYLGMGG
jgi:hypothetical protein